MVMGTASVPAPAFNSVASKTVHHALVIQTVKQTVRLLIKSTQRRDGRATFNKYCRLVNVYRIHHQPTAASGKAYQGSQG
jgi:hypothetical protein